MLRMTITAQTAREVVLAVDGKVAGSRVELLEREIRRHLEATGCLVLELDGLQFIDEAGLALLRQWTGRGLVLRGGSTFVQASLVAAGMESECPKAPNDTPPREI